MLLKTQPSTPILDFLKADLIQNLNILGILENLPEASIYVDHLSEPTGVIVNHGYFNYIYTANPNFMEMIVNDFLKDNDFFGFSGLEKTLADYLKQHMIVHWESPTDLYYLPKENFKPELKSSNTKPTAVAIEDAETINFFYTYKDDNSLERIRQDILNRPSSAIYIDGEIVSWLLVHEDNSMGIMFTKEAHRGKGYAVDLTIDLIGKLLEKDRIPFLQIVEGNTMSPGLARKCGFEHFGHAIWFGGFKNLPDYFTDISNQVATLSVAEMATLMTPQGATQGATTMEIDEPLDCSCKPKLIALKGSHNSPKPPFSQPFSNQFVITEEPAEQAVETDPISEINSDSKTEANSEKTQPSKQSKFKNLTVYQNSPDGQIECAKVGLYMEEADFPIVWRFEPTLSPPLLDIWHGLFEYFRGNGCTLVLLQPTIGRDYDNL